MFLTLYDASGHRREFWFILNLFFSPPLMFGQRIFAIRGNKSCTNDREGKAPENINIFRPNMYLISIFYDYFHDWFIQ